MNTTIEKQQIVTSNTEQWNMYSKLDGKEYQIHISKPRQPALDSGYPVIYVLDGNAFFKHSMKRLKYNQLEQKNRCFTSHYSRYWLSNRRAFSGEERCYDFTPSVISKDAALKPDGKPWPKTGGAHHFFTFIEEELKPQIEKILKLIKESKQYLGIL